MFDFPIPEFVAWIIDRLLKAGHQAYIVGGALRDAYLRRPMADWDVTTSATPEEVDVLFRDNKHFSLKQGTVTLVSAGRHFEVTAFRGPDKNLSDDLAYRDFTMNAMAYKVKEREIVDPFGGRHDMNRKLIKSVGDARTRFEEDPLRLLRAVRFAAELGFHVERDTLDTLSRMAPQLSLAAPERIREEVLKILMSPKPSKGLTLMARSGLLGIVFPELPSPIPKHVLETVDQVERSAGLKLAALLHGIAHPRVHGEAGARMVGEILERLKFSRKMAEQVITLIRHHAVGYESGWSDGEVRRFIRRIGVENMGDLFSLCRADILAHGLQKKEELSLLTQLQGRASRLTRNAFVAKTADLAIDGFEVMEILGLSKGPEIGRVLRELLEKVTDDPELNTPEALRGILVRMKNRGTARRIS